MANGTMLESSSQWILNTQLNESTQTITLSTSNKYVKNDIRLNIAAQQAQTAPGIAVGRTEIYSDANSSGIKPNLIKDINVGGQTIKDGKYSLHTSTTNADTYFYIILSEDLNVGQIITLSCEVSGFESEDSQWNFKFGNISDSALLSLHNGFCSTTVTLSNNYTANSKLLLDDNTIINFVRGSSSIKITNLKVEKNSEATAWVPNITDIDDKIDLGSKVLLSSGLVDKYYIPLKTTSNGYTKITQKGWIEEGNGDIAETINTNYISIPEATFENITTTADTSKVQLVSTEGYTEEKYFDSLIIPEKKSLDSLILTSGDNTTKTYLSLLDINEHTEVNNINLIGSIMTITANGGYVETVNLNNSNSYIDDMYGIGYIKTNSENCLNKYTQNGILTTYEGSGGIENYTNTGTITNMIGNRTITNLGISSTSIGTLNIVTNTNGVINAWGGKTKDKGVTIENHLVTVDGNGTNAGTTVTNTTGDLITTTLTFTGGIPSIKNQTNTVSISGMKVSTDATAYYVEATASAKASCNLVSYTNEQAGWLVAHTSATQALTAKDSNTVTFTSNRVYIQQAVGDVTMIAGNGSITAKSNVEFSTENNGIQVGGKGTVKAKAKITTEGYATVTDSFTTQKSASSNEATAYIKGVTLTVPTADTPNTFYIKVPNGDTGLFNTFTFKVDKNANVWIE